MPVILTKKAGTCAACGGAIQKGEEAFYTAEGGLRHPEPACSSASSASHRANTRPGRCNCGTWVEKGEGTLVHAGEESRGGRWRQRWVVRCRRCG